MQADKESLQEHFIELYNRMVGFLNGAVHAFTDADKVIQPSPVLKVCLVFFACFLTSSAE